MGIFDKLMGSKEIKLVPKSALALAALTVVASDGSIDENEAMGLVRLVRGDRDAFDKALRVLKDQPAAECVKLVAAALDEKQRRCVMANLLDLAMSDGYLAGAEKDLLAQYMSAFGMSEDSIKGLAEAMAVKNDFSVMK